MVIAAGSALAVTFRVKKTVRRQHRHSLAPRLFSRHHAVVALKDAIAAPSRRVVVVIPILGGLQPHLPAAPVAWAAVFV